ncbi:MAG: Flagellin N-methylase [Smithella sp. PtaU1.Bin162]|nr:MAG: Flagellin N-methylase [Smithella sp. PtaU1.Bin162]
MTATFSCLRCGRCCFVDFTAYAVSEDFNRWSTENRQDILNVIEKRHLVWAGDRMASTETGVHPYECPFLSNTGKECFCSIYETRPLICRKYQPGSSELCPQWKFEEQ